MKKKNKLTRKFNSTLIIALIVLFAVFGYYFFFYEGKEFHIHADFKVYVNGEFINFSLNKYQSDEYNKKHEYVHLHSGNGDVIHYHKDGITLGEFFKTLGMVLSDNCFTDDLNNSYCSSDEYELKTFVNGEEIEDSYNYIAKDLDRILIAHIKYDEDVSKILSNVTDKACIESALCPQRGEPSESGCVSDETCAVDFDAVLNE